MTRHRWFAVFVVGLIVGGLGFGARGTEPAPSLAHDHCVEPSPCLELVDQLGGQLRAVASADGHVFYGLGPRVVALDVSRPLQPHEVGRTDVLPGLVMQMIAHRDHLYVRLGARGSLLGPILVFDLADPQSLAIVGRLDVVASHLAVVGDQLVVYENGIQRYDISDPRQPQPLGRPMLLGLEKRVEGLALTEEWLVVLAAGEQMLDLHVVAMSAQDAPAGAVHRVVSMSGDAAFGAVAVSRAHAYLTYWSGPRFEQRRLAAVDLATTGEPVVAEHRIDASSGAEQLLAVDGVLFGIGQTLSMWELSRPDAPRLAGSLWLEARGQQLAVAHGWGYAVLAGTGLAVLDLRDTAAAEQVALAPAPTTRTYDLTITDDALYVVVPRGLAVLKRRPRLSTAAHVPLGTLATGLLTGLDRAGEHAYLGAANRVVVMDVVPPAGARVTAVVTGTGGAVAARDNYIYTSDLSVIDVRRPRRPRRVARLPIEQAVDVDLGSDDATAYVASRKGLIAVSVEDSLAPTLRAHLDLGVQLDGVALDESWAYLVSEELIIADVTDPSRMHEIGRFDPAWVNPKYGRRGGVHDVALTDGCIFVSGADGYVMALDVSDPAQPRPVAHASVAGGLAWRAAAVGRDVFVSAIEGGVWHYRLVGSAVPTPTVTIGERRGAVGLYLPHLLRRPGWRDIGPCGR